MWHVGEAFISTLAGHEEGSQTANVESHELLMAQSCGGTSGFWVPEGIAHSSLQS